MINGFTSLKKYTYHLRQNIYKRKIKRVPLYYSNYLYSYIFYFKRVHVFILRF